MFGIDFNKTKKFCVLCYFHTNNLHLNYWYDFLLKITLPYGDRILVIGYLART